MIDGFLDGQFRAWRDVLAGLLPAERHAPLGRSWGGFAESTTVDLALHVLDEVIHLAAGVGLLRDLYAHRASVER
jgi:hypothetical protein